MAKVVALGLLLGLLEVVEKLCARVIILHKGEVVADDSVERLRTLINLPSLERMFSELIEQRDFKAVASDIAGAIRR